MDLAGIDGQINAIEDRLVVFFHGNVSLLGLLYLPLIFGVQIALIMGVGLACAAANVFFRDVRSILVLCLQLWLYASPVIYPLQAVPEKLRVLYALNPMVGVIDGFRWAVRSPWSFACGGRASCPKSRAY